MTRWSAVPSPTGAVAAARGRAPTRDTVPCGCGARRPEPGTEGGGAGFRSVNGSQFAMPEDYVFGVWTGAIFVGPLGGGGGSPKGREVRIKPSKGIP